ncbi:MAG: hypothetical protein ACI4WH_07955 [Oscillospiraceae bacterium]
MEFESIDYILIVISIIIALVDVVLMAIRTEPLKSHLYDTQNKTLEETSKIDTETTSGIKE